MKLRLTSFFSILCVVPMIACGGDDGATGDGDGDGDFMVDPAGTHTQYVADVVTIPTMSGQSAMFALDIDGDNQPDNGLGGTLSALAQVGNLDLQTAVTDGVNAGSIIVLTDLQATSLTSASGVGMSFYLGENPTPAACTDENDPTTCGQHLDGNGAFDVTSGSPADALIGGALVGGNFETQAHGTVKLELELIDGQAAIPLELIGARTKFTVNADGTISSGVLVGAITKDQADTVLLPAISGIIIGIVDEDCALDVNSMCVCTGTGDNLQMILDANNDCVVTDEEVASNDLVASLFNTDVDMLNGTTFGPGIDEIDDAISLGLGFSSTGATFTRP